MSKPKFPRQAALEAAGVVVGFLAPHCERLELAGSLRRGKEHVGDIEILYIPKYSNEPDGFFETRAVNCVERELGILLRNRTLEKRLNARGFETWGPENKLARHTTSQIPLDLFATTAGHWFNYLVCRTGGADTNRRIATAAQRKGWKWHPYGAGFTDEDRKDPNGNYEPGNCRWATKQEQAANKRPRTKQ